MKKIMLVKEGWTKSYENTRPKYFVNILRESFVVVFNLNYDNKVKVQKKCEETSMRGRIDDTIPFVTGYIHTETLQVYDARDNIAEPD